MKARKTEIPADSLVKSYFPVDYKDAYVCEISHESRLTPDDIMVRFWTDFPAWVNFLFRVRNFLVKFVGLEGSMNSIRDSRIVSGQDGNVKSHPFLQKVQMRLFFY